MKHLFIINPVAGKGKSLEYIPKIEEYFSENIGEFIIEKTKMAGHAINLVKEYTRKEDYRIYSIGGDGTLNEVINGMAGSNSILGIIPAGSGNDFIRSLHKGNNYKDILKRTIEGHVKKIDLATVNQRYFINISSVGLDADIVYNARKIKNLPLIPGSLAYLISIFTTVFKYKSKLMKVHIDEKEFLQKTLLTTVSNGQYYGGGMKVTPDAMIDDGEFDICYIKEISVLRILTLFPKLIKGKHASIREVSFYKGKNIRISCEDELSLNVDGELLRTNEVEFNILPKGINVIVPTENN